MKFSEFLKETKQWGGNMLITKVPYGSVVSVKKGSSFNATIHYYLAHSDGKWHEMEEFTQYKGDYKGSVKSNGATLSDKEMADLGAEGKIGMAREGGSNSHPESVIDMEAMPVGTKFKSDSASEYEQPTIHTKLPDGKWHSDYTRQTNSEASDYMKQIKNTKSSGEPSSNFANLLRDSKRHKFL